nr:Flp pilus assembly protein CpaB [uncultured Eisenbergiella sp.]
MNFLKNRTVIGVLCIVLALVICFAVTPLFNQSISEKTEIVRVVKPVKIGEEITADKVKTVEVGAYNLPEDVVKNLDTAIGRYASADLAVGDYIIASKIADEPAAENAYLYSLTGEKQAMSISLKAFANGLSGKLQSGDIVSVIAPDYKKQGATVIPPELQYVEVIAVTATSGYDANTNTQGDAEDEEKELPGTVTLLVTPEQSKILAELEADGKAHLSLVYRGEGTGAGAFITAQEAVLLELYPPVEETEEATGENGSGQNTPDAQSTDTVQSDSSESEDSGTTDASAESEVE